ncbi:hypothetical protein CC030809_00231 [Synechococcus phage S-CAM7]|uniref:Alpha-1,2-fucosyltransferase n=1 Tax=Synechococcus phage S-CAM7 TaxID=1883368 RepID=A0A7D5FUG8_9CAUD|nr:hypothetical protein CC030809_00231 [Synechococcus phage S-CAM7]
MTISFNYLGNLGHLGNQMFQYAALMGLSSKYNRTFCIPHPDTFSTASYQENRSSIYSAFDIKPPHVGMSKFKPVSEAHFHFDNNLFENLPPQDIDLRGYFQCEKWFKHIEDDVRKAFTFKPEYMEVAQLMRDQLDGEVISLHIRRTDYITNPNHYCMHMGYYLKALKVMPSEPKVIIFSDDTEWAMDQKEFPDDRFLVSETNCPYTDMALMTLCDYHINANSSFSWWGSWLSNSKKVTAPSDWFSGPLTSNNLSDIYCDGWEVI